MSENKEERDRDIFAEIGDAFKQLGEELSRTWVRR